MRWLFILITLCTHLAQGQTPEQDEIIYQSSVDWLNSKLNYTYYNGEGRKWWKNTFYVNDQKEVTIKHISSKKPNTANIKDKNYIMRKFQIHDINPSSLKVSEVKKSQGRVTKGNMLEMRTYGFKNQIKKTINNKKASSTSFIYLSFPEEINDSVGNYAEIVKLKFKEAVLASTNIYAVGDSRDIDTIFSILNGEYISSNSLTWTTEKIDDRVLKVNSNHGTIQYFGYDNSKSEFYLLEIGSTGIIIEFFQMQNERNKRLTLQKDGIDVFSFQTDNSFTFKNRELFRQ